MHFYYDKCKVEFLTNMPLSGFCVFVCLPVLLFSHMVLFTTIIVSSFSSAVLFITLVSYLPLFATCIFVFSLCPCPFLFIY